MNVSREVRCLWIVIAAFVLLNAIIWATVDESVRLKQAGDGDSWYQPSIGFHLHGRFVYPDSPDQESIYRPPVFPVFAAGMFTLAGGPSPNAIAFGQMVLLLIAGLIFRNTVDDWLPGWGTFGMALLCFNPNVFTISQYTQSDTLFLFFMTVVLWAMLKYVRNSSGVRYALLAGGALAVATLTRPTAQFLIIVLPFALPLIEILNGNAANWLRGFLKGVGATLLGLAILFPWAYHIKNLEGSYDLSSTEVKARYIWDQIAIIEAQQSGLSYHEAEKKQTTQYEVLAASYGDKWLEMSDAEKYRAILGEGYRTLLAYPASAIAQAYSRSIIQFFVAGGSGRWHYILSDEPNQLANLWFKEEQTEILVMIRKYVSSGSATALFATAVCILFVSLARLVGLVGIASMIAARQWPLIIVLASYIAYFAFVHLFVGNSRYRISIEPALMLLFLYGISALLSRWKNWQTLTQSDQE
jgi:4-amino-4-deoxy-L-arabinose transferase-like glycosyltransferase